MDRISTQRLLEQVDRLLDGAGVFRSSGIYVVGDEQFHQWYGSVLQLLEEFDGELYGGVYHTKFLEIWQHMSLIDKDIDYRWQDEFWESFDLLNKVRSELFQSATFLSLQPILNHYIRLSSLGECSDSELKTLLTKLENICAAEDVSIPDLARHGRIIAEVCVNRVYHHLVEHPSLSSIKLDFNGRLREITGPLNLRDEGHIVSYLRLLQSCGNIADHPTNSELMLLDGHAVLSASIRLLEYAYSLRNGSGS